MSFMDLGVAFSVPSETHIIQSNEQRQSDIDHEIIGLVSEGNISLQASRCITDDDISELRTEVREYEFCQA